MSWTAVLTNLQSTYPIPQAPSCTQMYRQVNQEITGKESCEALSAAV